MYTRSQELLVVDESASLNSGTIGKSARKRKEDAQKCVLHRVEEAARRQNPHSCKDDR